MKPTSFLTLIPSRMLRNNTMQPDSSCSYSYGILFMAILPLLLFLLLGMRRRKPSKAAPNLPPGPWRLPVIGSLHHLMVNPLKHRLLADMARRHRGAPLVYLQLGEVPAVVVSSRDAAREVMKTRDAAFATRPMCVSVRATAPDGLGLIFAPYSERWRHLRKLCAVELLSAARVRSLRAVREDEAARLVAAAATAAAASSSPSSPSSAGGGGGLANVTALVTAFVTDSVLRAIVGERFRRRDEFLETLAEGVRKISPGMNVGDLFPSSRLVGAVSGTVRMARAFRRRMDELVDSAIEQHQERKAAAGGADDTVGDTDLLGVLLRIQKTSGLDCPLTMGTVRALMLDLFGAGSETTSTSLLWVISELMRNTKVMQKAQAEIRHALRGKGRVTEDDLINLKFLKLVIKESLRLHAPIPLLVPRECMESCKILGYDIPQGALVLVNVWAIGRDPRYWDDALEFKPERFMEVDTDLKGTDFEFLPFGAGRRICPGTAFAQANMELALAALLFHFDWELPHGMAPRELDMTEEMGITARRKKDLYLRPTVHVLPVVA
ncbi:hypothetical protein ACP4OV_014168 [Aristida adscensionis]